jgi:16S rRNA (cytosine1402-N4)-methyltransferase
MDNIKAYHTSVLLQETIEYLQIKAGENYIDGTLGGGGHTIEILKHGGKVLGIDIDQDALDYVAEKFKVQNAKSEIGKELFLIRGNFKDIDTIAKENGFVDVAGILFDLGVSGHHFDDPSRGFSFQKEGPLDMRMDNELEVRAGDLINGLTKNELTDLFIRLGEERFARIIVSRLIEERTKKRIEKTTELAEIIKSAVPFSKKGIHPATKVFQALRIAVNDELNNLTEALPKALALLESGGRLAVISFHSLEDRIVKRSFLEFAKKNSGTIITKKPVIAGEEEIRANSRARSAKLRVFEKI